MSFRFANWGRTVVVLGVTAAFLLPAPAIGQATAYVPTGDPAYRDLDALVAVGLVRNVILGTRPYSQGLFARAVAEAKGRLRGNEPASVRAVARGSSGIPKRRILEALARLESRFTDEAARGIRGVRMDAAWVESPPRAVQSRTGFDGIDADVAPLIQRNAGREIPNGSSIAGEAWGDIRLGAHLVIAVEPRIWLAAPRDDGPEAGAELVTGYARALLGNLSVDVGRNTLARGTSLEMNPTLSTNARGLDMVRFSMERPVRLPWVLRYLGPAKFAGLLATLGRNRDNPGGVLVVWEASMRPVENLELGVTLMDQQGGKGAPRGTFVQRLEEALIVSQRVFWMTRFLWGDPGLGDHFVGWNARLTLPGTGAQAYLEFGTTEDAGMFLTHGKASLWNEAAWLGGMRWQGLGDAGRLDLVAEVAHNGPGPYSHVSMTSGLTLDRRVLGSPLGPSATSVQGGAAWTGTTARIAVTGAWEHYSADQFVMSGDTNFGGGVYIPAGEHPGESRLRLTAEWARELTRAGRPTTNIRVGYEHVTRFNFTEASRANILLQAGLAWAW